jgi:phosphoribosylaminoimidazole-succinocarboxamide synthase
VEAGLWEEVQECALALFHVGQQFAVEGGLILVDTKYEFGLIDGKLILIDEVHTPDSSRFWIHESYEDRHAAEEEPEQLDKEVLRMHFVKQGYSGNGDVPPIPPWLAVQMAQKYISAFENLTRQNFCPGAQPAVERVKPVLEGLLGMK